MRFNSGFKGLIPVPQY